jgi:hypothetical protein
MAPNDNQTTPSFREAVGSLKPTIFFIIMIFGALIAFEIFNYTTTDHALTDLLGDLRFAGIRWSTILAVAFCGIDFAGIARLFTPEQGADEPKEVWYLFGAWLLAATMNAILTWWGVSIAILSHSVESTSLIDPRTLTGVVPVFVAVMVWVIRILIIGTLSMAMDRMLHPNNQAKSMFQSALKQQSSNGQGQNRPAQSPAAHMPSGLNSSQAYHRSASAQAQSPSPRPSVRPNTVASRHVVQQTPLEEDDFEEEVAPTRPMHDLNYHSLSASQRNRPGGSSGEGSASGNRTRR